MKKITPLIVSMAIVMIASLFAGAVTMTYFSDIETSSVNVLTAGTLDLKIDADPSSGGVNWVDDPNVPTLNSGYGSLVDNLKPGDSAKITVGIKNDGSIDGIADIHIKNVNNNGGQLGDNIDVKISYGDKGGTGTFPGTETVEATGYTLDTINCLNFVAPVTLEAGDDDYWVIELSIDSGVGNGIQGDSVSFDVEFSLNQA